MPSSFPFFLFPPGERAALDHREPAGHAGPPEAVRVRAPGADGRLLAAALLAHVRPLHARHLRGVRARGRARRRRQPRPHGRPPPRGGPVKRTRIE